MYAPTTNEAEAAERSRLLQENWVWLFGLGVGLIVLGAVAAIYSIAATITAVTFFGVMLVLGSAVQIVSAVRGRDLGGFVLHLLTALLYLVLGVLMIEHPLAAAAGLTLMLAAAFMVGGLFRIVLSLVERFHGWGAVLLNGVITFLLGVFIWRQWPFSGLWVIGLFAGIEMIFAGVSWVMLGVAGRMLRKTI